MSRGDQGIYSSPAKSKMPSSHISAEVERVVGSKSLEFRGKVCNGHINAGATRLQMFFVRVDETTKQDVCV